MPVERGALLLKPWDGRDLAQAERHLREGLGVLHGHRVQMLDGLCYFAELRAEPERWPLAARLLGAADGSREELGTALSLSPEEFETLASRARACLEPAEFAAAWNVGRATTLEQAVEDALAVA